MNKFIVGQKARRYSPKAGKWVYGEITEVLFYEGQTFISLSYPTGTFDGTAEAFFKVGWELCSNE